jgi:hypothetical protein
MGYGDCRFMIDIRSFNPDVLSCLANLSNDEVFTPPKLANEILDLLPQSLWNNKDAIFLDPCSKTGVFLREIAKQLLKGLEKEIPDLHDRINHIFKNQLYGIAITELTAHLARRSVYCSKHAAGKYSVRDEMLNDKRLRNIIDYPVSSECFPGVEIKGGICYFLWNRDNPGDCEVKTLRGDNISILKRPLLEIGSDIFIRYNESIDIFRKVTNKKSNTSFSELVSTQKPFGFRTFVKGKQNYFPNAIKLYANNSIGFVKDDEITQNISWVKKHKVYITMAYGAGEDFPHQIINKPFYGEPNSCCTETYLVIGPFNSKKECSNVISYISTRFFRFLVLLRKNTQHAAKGVYSFVPVQDFSEPWTDEKLYKKYGLTQDEIAFIESMIRPMESANGRELTQIEGKMNKSNIREYLRSFADHKESYPLNPQLKNRRPANA